MSRGSNGEIAPANEESLIQYLLKVFTCERIDFLFEYRRNRSDLCPNEILNQINNQTG